ncbi:integrase, partial [Bacillus cereus]|nr:integrase [Bacillus cereus]
MALKKRERRVPAGGRLAREYPQLSLEQAIDFVISAKKSEGLRERSLKDYAKHYGYFVDWLREKHPDIQYVEDITTEIIRDHVA